MAIPGTRGAVGKKTVNASTQFAALFDEIDDTSVQSTHDDGEFTDEEESKLDQLELQVKE